MKEEYLTEKEKKMVLGKIRAICFDEFNTSGALKNRRLVTIQDLPWMDYIMMSLVEGELIFTRLPNDIKSLFLCVKENELHIHVNDPLGNREKTSYLQVSSINSPEVGKSYILEDYGVDIAQMSIQEGERTYYNFPWDTNLFCDVIGSRIEAYLLGNSYIYFRMINVEEIPSVIFRMSTHFDNSLDLVPDYGMALQPGDYRVPTFDDGLIVCDAVLHAALKQQAFIYTVGNPYEGKYVYRVVFRYFDEPGMENIFVDESKKEGLSCIKQNRKFFSEQ